jgi:DNA ligase-1
MTSPIPLETRQGLYLPDLDLWLDPHTARDNAFVSHAHADHFARHENILCSDITATLLRHRYRVAQERLHPQGFQEVRSVGDFRLQLFPAGHIFGSAMLHVTRTTDGASLLYTGDFKVRPGFTAGEPVFRQADTLIMETTFGKPEYVFPSLAETSGAVRNFVEGALEDGCIPILFGYSLGKAQEAVALLTEARIPCVSHHTVAEMTEACRAAGAGLPPPIRFEGEVPPGHALVCPPNAVRSKAIRALANTRMAFLSGWALNPGARFRYRVDEVFPLSDHADYPGLLECVNRVGPSRIITLHGFAREFAADLRERGWEAWSIHGDDQIELNLGRDPTARAPATHSRPTGELQGFSDLLERVRSASSRSRKGSILASYLTELSEPSLHLVATWLGGRALPTRDHGSLRLGNALIRRALLQATGLSLKQYRRVSSAQADASRTARILLEGTRLGPQAMDFSQVRVFLETLATTKATLKKADLPTCSSGTSGRLPFSPC